VGKVIDVVVEVVVVVVLGIVVVGPVVLVLFVESPVAEDDLVACVG